MIALRFILLFAALSASAATYYVDFSGGDNSAAGTSTATAWKNIPGTTTAADYTSFIAGAGWVKIQAGDTVKLKSGTTHDSAVGGMIRINATYYATDATVANPITFQRDSTWGSGSVTFDGTGDQAVGSGWGLFHITVGGIKFDGVTTDGLVIQNAPWNGISSYGASNLQGVSGYYLYFYNCGTSAPDSSASASEAAIKLLDVTGGTFSHCRIDGNGKYINGIFMGEVGKKADGVTIADCTITNHACGNPSSGDWGIGIKTMSSVVTVTNCELAYNFKGADNGTKTSGVAPVIKYLGNNVHNNAESGINANGGNAIGVSDTMTAYFINNLICSNATRGTFAYGGVMNIYLVGNVYHANGSDGTYSSCNVDISNNYTPRDESPVRAYLYNNIFYKRGAGATRANLMIDMWRINLDGSNLPSNISYDSDYNAWVQNTTERFCNWGSLTGSEESAMFLYGANGPGHSTGNWYNWYGGSTTTPTNGSTGHYHCDSHSKGTGCDDSTLPPFNAAYVLTNSFAGLNLSGQSWYIAEMGIDRNGMARVHWDIGPYEFGILRAIRLRYHKP